MGTEPSLELVDNDLDTGTDLTVAAIIRQGMGAPEPSAAEVATQLIRADAWRDCPAGPERLAHINELAAAFYESRYPDSWARGYLTQRFGVDLTGDPDHRPGYAPHTWTALAHHLRAHGVRDAELLATGLAATASTGRLIDRFRDRVVFPITHHGVVLGFVGRRHPERTDDDKAGPKYLNTGDTPLFHKGDQLFASGRHLAAGALPVIVEGPLDAIAVTLATGGKHVGVAPLGTSLTDAQAAQLRQAGHRTPIVATDADLAGRLAAERDYWILTPHHHDPRYAQLPDRSDPADLLARGQAVVLQAALRDARPLAGVLVEERFAHLPAPEATLDALRIVAARPAEQWETGLHDIATRLDLPANVLRPTLRDLINAFNRDPRTAAHQPLRDLTAVKARLALAEDPARPETIRTRASTGPGRPHEPLTQPVRVTGRGIDR